MIKKLALTLDIEPMAVQSARFYRIGNGIRSYQPEKVTGWKQTVRTLTRCQLPPDFKPFTRDVPLRIEVALLFSPPKSMKKSVLSKISSGESVYKTSRGDVDNYSKSLFDALNNMIWEDDSQIVDYRVTKRYSVIPGICVTVFLLQCH